MVNSAPRSTPIPIFPLPIYLFDSAEDKYAFFFDYDNDSYAENIYDFGRSVDGSHDPSGGNQALESNDLPGDAPDFANPVTPPVPNTANNTFWVHNNTDGFVFIHSLLDRKENPPDGIADHGEYFITGFSATFDIYHGAMTSIMSQWFLRAVDGIPRFEGGEAPDPNVTTDGNGLVDGTLDTDNPETFEYDGAQFRSIPVSFAWGRSNGAVPGGYGGGSPYLFNVPANNPLPQPNGVQKVYPVDTAATTVTDAVSSQQNKVDDQFVVKEDKDTVADAIITKNDNAQRFPLAANPASPTQP
ncbi:MAG: hypothetical protein HUU29_01875, partial [Planctomycetaceae bacterium]|nr:hypothetical protein [Planctomycetaceae bacterium]